MLTYDPGMLKLCQNVGINIDALYFLTKKKFINSIFKNRADVENVWTQVDLLFFDILPPKKEE